jgi:hypothetical protein
VRRHAAALTALTLAFALPLALGSTRFHWVPLAGGGDWRGLSAPPTPTRLLLAALAGFALALLALRLGAARRQPLLALLVTALPLVPVAIGVAPALLLFQGPALLLVAGAAAGAVLGTATAAPDKLGLGTVIAVAASGYALLGLFLPGPAGAQGDEPHYLAQAQSLLSDGDLDLTDEFEAREYAAFFPGRLEPHASPNSPAGRLYSIHTPGLPALILPAYAVAGYPGARLFLSLLAAWTAGLTWRCVRRTEGPGLAAACGAAIAFTPPLPFYAVAIYPELPAALATALFLGTTRGDGRAREALLAAALAAALPWLHPKLLPLGVVGLGLTLIRGGSPRLRVAAVAATLASWGALLVFLESHYGSASLAAAYGPGFSGDVSPQRALWGGPALLLDRQFGLLSTGPLWALAVPGAWLAWRRRRSEVVGAALLAGATLGVGASFSMWWGGACPPARFAVPALPALAVLLAPAFRARHRLAGALAGFGIAVVLLAAHAPRAIHNRPDGESGLLRYLAPGLDLDPLLPSFVSGGGPAAVALAAGLAGVGWAVWRHGSRGALIGGGLYLGMAAGLSNAPLVHARSAALRLLDDWQPDAIVGTSGPLDLEQVRVPLDLRDPPWQLAPLETRTSRPLDVPPGRYRVYVDARAVSAQPETHVLRLELSASGLLLERAFLQEGAPPPGFELLLPAGARRLRLAGRGVQGGSRLDGIALAPIDLVPRDARPDFPWPGTPTLDRYRVGDGAVRATALDASAPDGDGFRLDGAWGRFTVEAPPGVSVRVRVTPRGENPGDHLRWGGTSIPLGRAAASLELPANSGVRLGTTSLIAVRVRSEGAWIGFGPVR